MHSLSKEKDVLRLIQELFCLKEFVVSSDPQAQGLLKPFFLKGHLECGICHME